MNNLTQSRLSYTHQNAEFRAVNPLYEKVNSITYAFETNRDIYNARQLRDQGKTEAQRRRDVQSRQSRRESFMVKRQKPQPVLRPSHSLSHETDRATFNNEWANEQKKAKSENFIRAAKSYLDVLYQERSNLNEAGKELSAINNRARNGNYKDGLKELFKLGRTIEKINQRVTSKEPSITRGIKSR